MVGFSEELLPDVTVHFHAGVGAEDVIEIFNGNLAIVIVVKNLECNFDILRTRDPLPVYAGAHELLEIYVTVSVLIALLNDFIPVNIILIL